MGIKNLIDEQRIKNNNKNYLGRSQNDQALRKATTFEEYRTWARR